MREAILEHLKKIERKEEVEILFAVESGSRAWGFESPDSDYDVRFIYKRSLGSYLNLEKTSDVIEYILTDELDINGWDLCKALRLLHASNPTLMEWCNSRIIYRASPFFNRLNGIKNNYFLSKSGLWHYLSMAKGNYREYLRGETVRLKKYFYVIRPILACEWILKNDAPPPMPFRDLLIHLPRELNDDVGRLLDIKMNRPEVIEGKRIDSLNEWIEGKLDALEIEITKLPADTKRGWEELNGLFLSEVTGD